MRYAQPALTFVLLFAVGTACAEMYKWVDKDGVTRYGDRIPPEYAKQEREVLNSKGQTIKVLEQEKTDADIAEEARQAELERQEQEQARRDRMLLDMYASEEDLIKARDEQIAHLDGNIRINEIALEGAKKDFQSRKEREAQLTKEGKPVPPDMQRQIRDLQATIKRGEKSLAVRQKERQAIASRFDRDIIRWRQLRGVTAPAEPSANQGTNAGVGK